MSMIQVSAKLDRSDRKTPWGFRMAGGKDFNATLIIQKVNPGSLSEKCGLKEGDKIVRIGDFETKELNHKEAQDIIISQGNSLNLKLERQSQFQQLDSFQPYALPHQQFQNRPPVSPPSGLNIIPRPFGQFNKTISSVSSNFSVSYPASDKNKLTNNQTSFTPSSTEQSKITQNSNNELEKSLIDNENYNQHKKKNFSEKKIKYESEYKSSVKNNSFFSDSNEALSKGAKLFLNRKHENNDSEDKLQRVCSIQFTDSPVNKNKNSFSQNIFNLTETIIGEERKKISFTKKDSSQTKNQNSKEKEKTFQGEKSKETVTLPSSWSFSLSNFSNNSIGPHPIQEDIVMDSTKKQIVIKPKLIKKQNCESQKNQNENIHDHQEPLFQTTICKESISAIELKNQSESEINFNNSFEKASEELTNEKRNKMLNSFNKKSQTWNPQVPSGERKVRIGKAGQAEQKYEKTSSDRVPICSNCFSSIRGPFITALDKTWCPNHFVCSNPSCQQSLIHSGFVEEQGKLYCEKDFEKYLAPICANCLRPIVGEIISVLGLKIHPDCFKCRSCSKLMPRYLYRFDKGDFYCMEDWAKIFQNKCNACNFPIEVDDRWLEALAQNWHSECFNCSTCQVNLDGQSFCVKNNKPYCKKHVTSRAF